MSASILCTGDFSDDMRKLGAAGSDWSDWDAHLPASPTSSVPLDSLPSSLNRTLSTQTSNKFEVAEGIPSMMQICWTQ